MSGFFFLFWGGGVGDWGLKRLAVLCADDLGIIRLIFSIGEI